jgi:riboflavin kinase
LKTITLHGTVVSGKGEGENFVKLAWVRKQIQEKLGFTPYPGTLNLKLDKKNIKLNKTLHKEKSVEISPHEGFHRGKCFQAHIASSIDGAVVFPEVANYPENIIEIIAPVNLREKLQIKNGDSVEVKINL